MRASYVVQRTFLLYALRAVFLCQYTSKQPCNIFSSNLLSKSCRLVMSMLYFLRQLNSSIISNLLETLTACPKHRQGFSLFLCLNAVHLLPVAFHHFTFSRVCNLVIMRQEQICQNQRICCGQSESCR